MMRIRYILMAVGLFLVTLAFGFARAQDDDTPPLLTLTSPDNAHPVQFQPLTPGDVPISTDFVSRLDIDVDCAPLIYVILENTGWSDGVIGLISDLLDPEAQYVALEVGADGVPIEGGLAFDLTYDEELGENGGFVLPVLISQMHTFGVFRVVESGGLAFAGVTNTRNGNSVSQEAVDFTVDPEPVFAPFVLECHIVARSIPPAPPEIVTSPGAPGGWGACGSCDTCGYTTAECMLSPEGQCVWNPSVCSPSPSLPENTGQQECVCFPKVRCVLGDPYPGEFPGEVCQDFFCYDTCGKECYRETDCGGPGDG